MNSISFGKDPDDIYSTPIGTRQTNLSKIFLMKPRENPEKPGRKLSVVWDSRVPLVEGFENNYTYTVEFANIESVAGNHYHKKKKELFYPVVGDFDVILEDIETKEKEQLTLSSKDHRVLLVNPPTAHVVIAKTHPAILLVTATYPNNKEDEFKYILKNV
mgnify:CR=1 FL=1